MRNALYIYTLGLILALPGSILAAENVLSAREKADGFTLLFNGKDAAHWTALLKHGDKLPLNKSNFSIDEQGNLFASGSDKSYWMRYEKEFGDFVLRLEYRVGKGANSGIFLRIPDGKGHPAYTGFEVQLLDDYGQQPGKHTSAAIYDVITPMRNMSKPAGEWNTMEIVCDGPLVVVKHNGFKVVDVDFSTLTEPSGKFSIP